ncbi:ABC transporter permease [Phycisphaera mikurensis]|uniref:Transport permease protein n=1 Tax=Phycisphaera mikurensis (strain NBRC 102666 / KCTC 22515 / FYK2301M01) TaxID=1142394 RepID=I0IE40_PHYMF|nr:ABC transporter permease [Phycisphaera mikurensis]MBB6441333.1 lipopolysaccharide transport system permease protein [Phycisphaera mikurensis]BAM03528.1 putative polysaccharide ABC transporter permease protein [Phycisphaera mikurensis NBRC 102666]
MPATAPEHPTIHLRPRAGWQAVDLPELWRARDLIWLFALRDVKVRYKQTFFGYAWALLVPAAQVLVFTIVFGKALGVEKMLKESFGRDLPYPLFALAGQLVWNFFKTGVDGASGSLINNGHIVRKVYVPRLVLPIASIGKPLADAAVVLLLLLGATLWYAADSAWDVGLSWRVVLAPLALVGVALPALGIGLISASLTVNFRDLQYVLPLGLQILFYVSAVIYPLEVLPEHLQTLAYLNPAVGFVKLGQWAVLGLPLWVPGLLISLAVSAVLVIVGVAWFARAERVFADVA